MLDTILNRPAAGSAEVSSASDSQFYDKLENDRLIQAYSERVTRINALEDDIELLSDEQLAAKTIEFREQLQRGSTEDELLEEAFAVVREAAWRTLELRHYDVQLVGAMALHDGKLAQMATGEGKTLVATCAVYLNALSGFGAFVVTVNDYLARRDAETMGQVYSFLGLKVGLIQQGLESSQRREAYAADVTYVTNSELGFDFLRDNLATSQNEVVLRPKLNFCIVDEGDSVLVDEARVPLVISDKTSAPVDKHFSAKKLAAVLERDVHYEVFEKDVTVKLTDQGVRDSELALQVSDLFSPKEPWAAYVVNSIKAKELFEREKAYIVRGDEVMIVDEFSGRVMEGRRWGDGLHQAIEAKEGLPVQAETEVVASITYQSLFRSFLKLASMSGTALTEAAEFATIYKLLVVDIPTVLPSQRVDIPNSVFKTIRGKSNAALQELIGNHRRNRPVLVGTTSISSSEAFSAKLVELGIEHEVLNASPESNEREAEIIAQAGRAGKVTIATNMAGRGTDILLGGNPAYMARLRLRAAITEPCAIAASRPAPDFYPSNLSEEAEELVAAAVAAYTTSLARSGGAVDRALETLDEMLAVAASSAEVSEDSVEMILREALEEVQEEYTEALAAEKQQVLEAGGLHVIGTNLHDSRRIDGQLRGRAGRQGDPGSSHFFLSLEDRIFRLFGGDKVKGVLDFLRVSEDQPLESAQVAKAVEDTQARVERYYYELRQKMFEFDEVLAAQRDATYSRRAAILRSSPAEMRALVLEAVQATASDIISANWKVSEEDNGAATSATASNTCAEVLTNKLKQFFPKISLKEEQITASPREEVERIIKDAVDDALAAKEASLELRKEGLACESQRFLALVQSDLGWKEHMKAMNYVKEFAGLKAYSGADPLQVYREEGLELFASMQKAFRQNIAYSFFQYEV